MKPHGMRWGYFFAHHYELWPLFFCVGAGMADLALFIINGAARKDYIAARMPYPWDKLDMLKHPYHRKLVHINQEYDMLPELDQLYREMDMKERELAKRRKREREQRQRANKAKEQDTGDKCAGV